MQNTTDVIFRVFHDGGDVFALFPSELGTCDEHSCLSYQHVGQHSSADVIGCIYASRPARPYEYATLKFELESPPFKYTLRIRHRLNQKYLTERKRKLEAMRVLQ